MSALTRETEADVYEKLEGETTTSEAEEDWSQVDTWTVTTSEVDGRESRANDILGGVFVEMEELYASKEELKVVQEMPRQQAVVTLTFVALTADKLIELPE